MITIDQQTWNHKEYGEVHIKMNKTFILKTYLILFVYVFLRETTMKPIVCETKKCYIKHTEADCFLELQWKMLSYKKLKGAGTYYNFCYEIVSKYNVKC